MALSRPIVLAVILAAGVIAVLFVPVTWFGVHDYNVKVETTISETCFIACSYSVESVTPSVAGPASVYTYVLAWADPSALGVAGPCLDCHYQVTASLSGGPSASVGETKFVSNLLNFDYTDSLTLGMGFVQAGDYAVTVTVTLDGGTIATGTSSLCVGC